MANFRYDFQSSGFHIVDLVIDEIIDQPVKDHANDDMEAEIYQMIAALSYGYDKPLTPEQVALNTYLTSIKAGKQISVYAWGLLHNSLTASA